MNKLLSTAWIVSIVAVLGSLYFSEIAGFIPCQLCWYQRILMYPLVVIIGVGLYVDDAKLPYYVLPLSILGVFVSGFHYLHQKTEWFATAVQCTQGVPCSGEYINWIGFITIPFLALTAFIFITIFLILQLKK
ncbi:disulfide oxidoreductase [Alkalihalobacillus sp. AL-G]|uniref:disulfide oxidoreductase n=1 Tax=Alkalihalobacillus sp. AL-G TaxID=2926399 RepID=UPI002729EA63|nr:disulfide oxidoreductase [Alkalihalobacillus sp. AL-G]WLD94201.1 disulfide oxidoreductase [Alkalihalobacillus sp. AL-G]